MLNIPETPPKPDEAKKMKNQNAFRLALATLALCVVGNASAAAVSCGNLALGIRTVTIDPAMAGGLCYAVNGNLDPLFTGTTTKFLDAGGTTIQLIGKEVTPGDAATSLLDYTIGGTEFGTWTVASSAWSSWDRLFIGFHFGGAGDVSETNPDSFVVELMASDLTGSWALGGAGARLTGLSNIYLFGKDSTRPPDEIPEPGTLALVGLALIGASALRRRKS